MGSKGEKGGEGGVNKGRTNMEGVIDVGVDYFSTPSSPFSLHSCPTVLSFLHKCSVGDSESSGGTGSVLVDSLMLRNKRNKNQTSK